MSETDYARGQADARLDMNDRRHEDNSRRFDAIEAKLDELNNTLAVAKGGLRMLIAVGTFCGALGAAAHSIFSWIADHWR